MPRIWLICGCSGRLSKSVRLSVTQAVHSMQREPSTTPTTVRPTVRLGVSRPFFSRCQRVLSSAPFRRASAALDL